MLDLLEAMAGGGLDGLLLVVSGIGPDLDEAKARADERTTFLGYVPIEDVPEVYRGADVFVSPTYSEEFSNTILEAMASGLPVVTTDSVGVVDAVRDGGNGCCTTPATSPASPPRWRGSWTTARCAPGWLRPRWRRCAGCTRGRCSRGRSPGCTSGWPAPHRTGPRLVAARRGRPLLPVPVGPAPAVKVLAVSPHLDDAAFSVGGTLAALAAAGHEVTAVTCLTASVPDPTGFALACQLDKGLGADMEYMALRRAEDTAAMAVLGATPVHLDLPEAPHRGYGSAPELFAGPRPDDEVWREVAVRLEDVDAHLGADLWLAPQGLDGPGQVETMLARPAAGRVLHDALAGGADPVLRSNVDR